MLIVGVNYGPEHTGIAPYTVGMAQAFAKDHEVQVLTTHPHYPMWRTTDGYGQWRRDEDIDGVSVSRLRHHVPARPQGIGRVLSEISFAARCLTARVERPDVVVVVSPAILSVVAARQIARRFRVPLAVVVQDLYSRAVAEAGVLGGHGAGVVSWVESTLLRSAAAVVTIHPTMSTSLVERMGLRHDVMTVIRNWTHLRPGTSDRAAVRQRMGWRDDETIVLHAGNMGAKQGLANVVEAARLVGNRRIRFVLMGSGSDRSTLSALSTDVAAADIVPSVDESAFFGVLRAADVLLVNERPGVREMCLPSKLTSYFVASRPIVAVCDPLGATASEVRAAEAGVVVPPGDPAALLDAVLAITSSGEAEQMGAAGGVYAREHLSAATAAGSYRRWLSALLDDARVSPVVDADDVDLRLPSDDRVITLPERSPSQAI